MCKPSLYQTVAVGSVTILVVNNYNVFRSCSQNGEKRLLDSSCPSVRPFSRMEQLGPHLTDFHEIDIFRKYDEKI